MRQAGYLAAAGSYALLHHRKDLINDHRRAKEISECLNGLNFVKNIGIDNFKSSKELISPMLQKRYGLFFDTES